MALSPLSIFAVTATSFLLGAFISYLICDFKEDQHRNNYICQRHNESNEVVCDLRRALYWSRHAIWKHEIFARVGEHSRQWLIEEISKLNVQATIPEMTMPNDCCRDRMARVMWEDLEARGGEYRKRVEAGEDPLQVIKDVDPTPWKLF